jgi:hypothetical protein
VPPFSPAPSLSHTRAVAVLPYELSLSPLFVDSDATLF